MTPLSESHRYERKFVLPGQPCPGPEPGLKLNPGLFSNVYHPRAVNNIYLDSPGLSHYFRGINGAAERIKVRIRWYGELFGQIARPVLEFKMKFGLLGCKESFPLKPFPLDKGFCHRVLKQVLQDSDLPDHARLKLIGLEPALVNRYQRCYYQSADRNYRLTLDSGLDFFRVRPGHNTFLGRAARTSFRVLELRYDQSQARGADEIAGAFPFRMTKMSKYTHGVDVLDGC